MSITFTNTPSVSTLLRVLAAHGDGERGINRAEVLLELRPSDEGTVANIRTTRRRDHDNESVLNCGYRQVLSDKSACGAEPLAISKDGVQKLLKAVRDEWRTLKIWEEEGQGKIQVDEGTPSPLATTPVDRSEVEAAPVGELSIRSSQLLEALEACISIPPLDSTYAGEVSLRIEDRSLTVERRAGEMKYEKELKLSERVSTAVSAQIPHELLSIALDQLRPLAGKMLPSSVPSDGEIWLRTAYGWMWFCDYVPRQPVEVIEVGDKVGFFSLTQPELRAFEDAVKSAAGATAKRPLIVRIDANGLHVFASHPAVVELLTFRIPAKQAVARQPVEFEIRPDSLLSVLTAARGTGTDSCAFYLCEDPVLEFRSRQTSSSAEVRRIDASVSLEDSPLILWASGGDPKVIVESPHRHILLSFSELPKGVQHAEGEFERHLEKQGLLDGRMKIFLDSGAYSVWHAGAEVDIEEYIKFLKWNAKFLDIYVALDKIRGTVKENVENYVRMLDAGLFPLYVWHLYEDFSLLDELLDSYKDAVERGGIGSGGAPHTPDYIREPYICELITRVRTVLATRIHMFGTTSEWILKKYSMVYSADSTSWRFLGQNHRIQTPFGAFSTKPRDRTTIFGHRLYPELQQFTKIIELSTGFDLEGLASDVKARHLFNLAYLSFFEKHYAYQDWMKLEQKFIPVDELRKRGRLNLDNDAIIVPPLRRGGPSFDSPGRLAA